MYVSTYFNLERQQATLSFVDVDIEGDIKLFISPRALRLLTTEWGDECVALLQNFFGTVLEFIKDGCDSKAVELLRVLREPNETHLGLSRGRSRGRGLGFKSAEDVWTALSKSKAAQSGLLTDLEDTVLMIDGVSVDIVSDVLTNIIRRPLINFTNEVATQYGIPLTSQVASGPMWNLREKKWETGYVSLPVANDEKLLLVPKVIVRQDMDYDVAKYYRHYILEDLREEEIKQNSELVYILKTGKKKGQKKVYKKDVEKKYKKTKDTKQFVVEQTIKKPHLLQQYKSDNIDPSQPLTHRQLADAQHAALPDWNALLKAVTSTKYGIEQSALYERNVEALLSALFYPVLTNPNFQQAIHKGRKRIDIGYTNMGGSGFFEWLGKHYPAPHVFFECKNYGKDLKNPELDQISSRFSPSRGQFGLIVCRRFDNKQKFMERCIDTAKDHRGYVIPLDDSDLVEITKSRQSGDLDFFDLSLIKKKFDQLIM